MNKYIKIIRDRLIKVTAGKVSDSVALDLFKQFSERFSVESVTVSGQSGLILGTPSELVMSSYIFYHHYCPGIVDLITNRLLRNGAGTFVDIGANIGLITVPVARDSQAVVHAFEPEPINFGYLTRNVMANLEADRVTLHNIALDSKTGFLKFELSEDNFGDHRVRGESRILKEKFDETNRKVIEVMGERLDSVLNIDELPRPVIVKMDTQGAEAKVIKGGKRLFDVADYVLSEYCPYMLLRAGSEPSEFLKFVHGYPYAAMVDDQDNSDLEIGTINKVLEVMLAIPQDGSAVRHIDILLARDSSL